MVTKRTRRFSVGSLLSPGSSPSWRGWTRRHERLFLSAVAFVIAIGPIFLAATSADRVLTADRPEFYAGLARLWIAGFAVGLVVVLVYAARGSLIVRDPAKIATNLRRNQRIALLVVPFAFFLQQALPAFDWLPRADPRVLVVLVLGGFLVPLWPVVLYITFAIRPDEIFGDDPLKARAALE